MEIILLENIINLGNIGDKVSVKNGYGRNYLLKTGKALRFNKENSEYVSKKKDELNKKKLRACFFPSASTIIENKLLDVHAIQFILAVSKNISKLVSDLNSI